MAKTALIVGASGLVGRYCLDELLASDRYDQVLAVVRRPLERTHAKLEQLQLDFDRLEDSGSRLRADHVFCCLGTTMRKAGSHDAFRKVDYEYPLRLARVTRQAGASQFALVSSWGAHPRAKVFYSRVKGGVENAISDLAFPGLIIVRPSVLLGQRRESRPGETIGKLVLTALAPLLRGPVRRLRPIEARTVARAMVEMVGRELRGRHILESDAIEAMVQTLTS